MSSDDGLYMIHMNKFDDIDFLGLSGIKRSGFKSHYKIGDRYIYFIGGIENKHEISKICRFDLIQRKWEHFKDVPETYLELCPASYIENDMLRIYVNEGQCHQLNLTGGTQNDW